MGTKNELVVADGDGDFCERMMKTNWTKAIEDVSEGAYKRKTNRDASIDAKKKTNIGASEDAKKKKINRGASEDAKKKKINRGASEDAKTTN